ncbi:DNA translocase FtsK, partial [Candidatus Hakubella thermalkaliphila]
RFKLLAKTGFKSLDPFNQAIVEGIIDQESFEEPLEPLPYILVIIDELSDLMMISSAEVEDSICRLSQMARAVGLHLIIATQRPSVNVITGLIKANIPSRIAFEVTSITDSRVILDMAGAEKLVGRGDMLFLATGSSKPIRVQGAFVTQNEIEMVVNYIKKQVEPRYRQEIYAENSDDSGKSPFEDELLDRAIETVIMAGHASASLLQRRFRIGYARAGRLIDMMEDRGIVSAYEGSKPRTVLITMEEWKRMQERSREG